MCSNCGSVMITVLVIDAPIIGCVNTSVAMSSKYGVMDVVQLSNVKSP